MRQEATAPAGASAVELSFLLLESSLRQERKSHLRSRAHLNQAYPASILLRDVRSWYSVPPRSSSVVTTANPCSAEKVDRSFRSEYGEARQPVQSILEPWSD